MINREEILKGQILPIEFEDNLNALLIALNKFRKVYGKPMVVTSGYRSAEHNEKVGGSSHSAHLFARAADFEDSDRDISQFCLMNIKLLEDCGLWMEDPSYTPKKGDKRMPWVHLQNRPASKRVFIP